MEREREESREVIEKLGPRALPEVPRSNCHSGEPQETQQTQQSPALVVGSFQQEPVTAMNPLSFHIVHSTNDERFSLVGYSRVSHYVYGTRHNREAIKNKDSDN